MKWKHEFSTMMQESMVKIDEADELSQFVL